MGMPFILTFLVVMTTCFRSVLDVMSGLRDSLAFKVLKALTPDWVFMSFQILMTQVYLMMTIMAVMGLLIVRVIFQ